MSTCYRFTGDFDKAAVLEAVKKLDLLTPDHRDNSSTSFLITDGTSSVWAYHNEDGQYVSFERYGLNYDAAECILWPLARELGTSLLSEHDEGYYEEDNDMEKEE